MLVETQVTIRGSKAATWAVITDIANAATILSGVEKIEILRRPAHGIVGLKWRETRILFGKPASVDKWITQAVENDFYETRAEDGGFVFVTTMRLGGSAGAATLISSHDSRPQGLRAKIMSIPMSLFFRGMIRKAILQDLNDYKNAVEKA